MFSVIKRNGVLPPITVENFLLSDYGACKDSFDPNKTYIGMIIMAVYANGRWFTDEQSFM